MMKNKQECFSTALAEGARLRAKEARENRVNGIYDPLNEAVDKLLHPAPSLMVSKDKFLAILEIARRL